MTAKTSRKTPKRQKAAPTAEASLTPDVPPADPANGRSPSASAATLDAQLEVLQSLVVARLIDRLADGKKTANTDITAAVAVLRKAGKVAPDAPEQLGVTPEAPATWTPLNRKEKAELDAPLDAPLNAPPSGGVEPRNDGYLPF